MVAWALFGIHFWLLGVGIDGRGAPTITDAIGAFAIAMTAGLLAIAAPSGLGVREAVLVACLSPFMGVGAALGVALASRLVLTAADVLAAGVAGLSARRLRDARPAGVPETYAVSVSTTWGDMEHHPGPVDPAGSTGEASSRGRRLLAPVAMLATVMLGVAAPLLRAPTFYYWDDTAGRVGGGLAQHR